MQPQPHLQPVPFAYPVNPCLKGLKQLKAKSNLTEDMKNTDMLYWVGTMNAIKNQAEEIVFNELIYV